MKVKHLYRFLIIFTLALNFILISGRPVQGKSISGVYETVIYSSPQDPYYALQKKYPQRKKYRFFNQLKG